MSNHISLRASHREGNLAQVNFKMPASDKAALAAAALRAGVPLRRYVLDSIRARIAQESATP